MMVPRPDLLGRRERALIAAVKLSQAMDLIESVNAWHGSLLHDPEWVELSTIQARLLVLRDRYLAMRLEQS